MTLDGGVPVIDERGEAAVTGDFHHWMVIGNTCDFARDVADVPWSQIVPVEWLAEVASADLRALRRYEVYRRFFVPHWRSEESGVFIADLVRPVTIDKRALIDGQRTIARMSRRGWMLLHACLVRFLARDDGRGTA